jgi:hypothetical protein
MLSKILCTDAEVIVQVRRVLLAPPILKLNGMQGHLTKPTLDVQKKDDNKASA